jgi:hypothetical protein
MGTEAEQLHDSIDEVLESNGVTSVATTWDTDTVDACEYFLLAAGGRARVLLALVAENTELVASLRAASS